LIGLVNLLPFERVQKLEIDVGMREETEVIWFLKASKKMPVLRNELGGQRKVKGDVSPLPRLISMRGNILLSKDRILAQKLPVPRLIKVSLEKGNGQRHIPEECSKEN
jgi:hypothetical protein